MDSIFLVGLVFLGAVIGILSVLLFNRKSEPAKPELAMDDLLLNLENRFRTLSAELSSAHSKELKSAAREELRHESEMQRKEIELLTQPLKEVVENYRKELNSAEERRVRDSGSLGQLLKTLAESNEGLRRETSALSGALKRPGVRGRWGEVQLRRIVELSGMQTRVDFTEQNTVVNTDEQRLRPDMVIHLPAGRQIVVDSKAVLASYLEAEEAIDETLRKAALVRHASALRTRMMELSKKSYWEQFEKAPDFVILFIPGEVFFSAALAEDPSLMEDGFEKKVVLATPTTLMALLRAVAFGWRQEQLAENAKKIGAEASRMYQAISVWMEHMSSMGAALDRTTKNYNQAVGSLERSVLPVAKRLRELGVSAKTEITELNQIETQIRTVSSETDTPQSS